MRSARIPPRLLGLGIFYAIASLIGTLGAGPEHPVPPRDSPRVDGSA